MLKKNRKGWIMIMEAFIGILLITSVLVISLNNPIKQGDPYEKIYSIQNAILAEIQMNGTLRDSILDAGIPVNSYEQGFPQDLNNTINLRKPNYLECASKICPVNDECEIRGLPKLDIYAESVLITANLQKYEARKLKLFCWESA